MPVMPNAIADMAKGCCRRQGSVSISDTVRATEKVCHWIVSRISPSAIATEPSTATSTQSAVRGPLAPGARGSPKKVRSRLCIKYALVGVTDNSLENATVLDIGHSDDVRKVCARYEVDATGNVEVAQLPPMVEAFSSLHE